jgi:saccharopine dehydrogenase (NAD+, L-lysine-forming)
VPPVVGAIMMFRGAWKGTGVFNVEQLPPEPFLEELGKQGLPWHVKEIEKHDQKKLFAVET